MTAIAPSAPKLVLYSGDQLHDSTYIFDAMFWGETVELWNAGSQHRESMREKWPAHTVQLVQDQDGRVVLPTGLFRITRPIDTNRAHHEPLTLHAPDHSCTFWWFLDELGTRPLFLSEVMANYYTTDRPQVFWDAARSTPPYVYPCVLEDGIGMVCIDSADDGPLRELQYPPELKP